MDVAGLKLLAVDDNQDHLATLQAIVRAALPECVLLTASNNTRCLELARSEDPDVLQPDGGLAGPAGDPE